MLQYACAYSTNLNSKNITKMDGHNSTAQVRTTIYFLFPFSLDFKQARKHSQLFLSEYIIKLCTSKCTKWIKLYENGHLNSLCRAIIFKFKFANLNTFSKRMNEQTNECGTKWAIFQRCNYICVCVHPSARMCMCEEGEK